MISRALCLLAVASSVAAAQEMPARPFARARPDVRENLYVRVWAAPDTQWLYGHVLETDSMRLVLQRSPRSQHALPLTVYLTDVERLERRRTTGNRLVWGSLGAMIGMLSGATLMGAMHETKQFCTPDGCFDDDRDGLAHFFSIVAGGFWGLIVGGVTGTALTPRQWVAIPQWVPPPDPLPDVRDPARVALTHLRMQAPAVLAPLQRLPVDSIAIRPVMRAGIGDPGRVWWSNLRTNQLGRPDRRAECETVDASAVSVEAIRVRAACYMGGRSIYLEFGDVQLQGDTARVSIVAVTLAGTGAESHDIVVARTRRSPWRVVSESTTTLLP